MEESLSVVQDFFIGAKGVGHVAILGFGMPRSEWVMVGECLDGLEVLVGLEVFGHGSWGFFGFAVGLAPEFITI